jgi:hypothetical protein
MTIMVIYKQLLHPLQHEMKQGRPTTDPFWLFNPTHSPLRVAWTVPKLFNPLAYFAVINGMAGALQKFYKIVDSHTQPGLGRGSLCDAQATVGTNSTHTPTDWP